MPKSMKTLKKNETATIKRIVGTYAQAKRLCDMGFVEGVTFTMIRPGSPCIIKAHGRQIAMGRYYQEAVVIS